MKKIAIVLSILALSSCSKSNIDEETKVGDYVCNCTYISALGDPEKKNLQTSKTGRRVLPAWTVKNLMESTQCQDIQVLALFNNYFVVFLQLVLM